MEGLVVSVFSREFDWVLLALAGADAGATGAAAGAFFSAYTCVFSSNLCGDLFTSKLWSLATRFTGF